MPMLNDDPLIYMIDRKGKIIESDLIADTKSSKSGLSSSLNIDSVEKQRVNNNGSSRRYSNNDSLQSNRSTANRAIQTDSSLSIQSLNSSSSTSTRRSSNKTQQQNDSQLSLNNITLLKY
jgi:hypothetical protein